jgi:hypothetical protein
MTEDEEATFAEVRKAYEAKGWDTRSHNRPRPPNRRASEAFVNDMWEKYRPTLDAPIDRWRQQK